MKQKRKVYLVWGSDKNWKHLTLEDKEKKQKTQKQDKE